MTLWNAEGLKPNGYLVWPLRSLKFINPFLTLTWPDDLTFGDLGLKLLHKVSNLIVSRCCKNGGAARRRFSNIREKRRDGHFLPPPPSNARVKEACIRLRGHWQTLDGPSVSSSWRCLSPEHRFHQVPQEHLAAPQCLHRLWERRCAAPWTFHLWCLGATFHPRRTKARVSPWCPQPWWWRRSLRGSSSARGGRRTERALTRRLLGYFATRDLLGGGGGGALNAPTS